MKLTELLGHELAALRKPISLREYLDAWASDSELSANAAGRIIRAIGKPTIIDTSRDPRLARMYSGDTIRRHPRLSHFLGIDLQRLLDRRERV